MHELLCVLLWLSAIASPGSYSEAEVYAIEDANQPVVDNTLQDPTAMSTILITYGPDAELIYVYDYRED